MKDEKQNNHHSGQDVEEKGGLTQVFYNGQPLPEWLQYPIVAQQRPEEPERIPDWVLEPVHF